MRESRNVIRQKHGITDDTEATPEETDATPAETTTESNSASETESDEEPKAAIVEKPVKKETPKKEKPKPQSPKPKPQSKPQQRENYYKIKRLL